MAKVKVFFQKYVKLKGQGQKVKKIMVPRERPCHKEYTCTILKPCLFWFESYAQG